jgi:hypothetical protein
MNIFNKNWLTETPYDYELKQYRLLSGIKEIKSLILDNSLYSAMSTVETELEILYNIKYNRDIIDNNSRKIIGIDTDTLSLKYKYESETEHEIIYKVCDMAIELLEDMYRLVRDKWRNLEKNCIITEIPNKRTLNTTGYIMYIDAKLENIEVYSYKEPLSFKIDWINFKVNKQFVIKNNLQSIAQFISEKELESNKFRFFRFDVKIKGEMPAHDECMIPLMQYCIFNRIKHGI